MIGYSLGMTRKWFQVRAATPATEPTTGHPAFPIARCLSPVLREAGMEPVGGSLPTSPTD